MAVDAGRNINDMEQGSLFTEARGTTDKGPVECQINWKFLKVLDKYLHENIFCQKRAEDIF